MDFKRGLVDAAKSSTVLVISPLVALMIDQVKSLRSRDVKCCIMTSSSSCGVDKDLLGTDSSFLTDSLLLCTPKALVRSKWRQYFDNAKISERVVALVVDKAHCISKW